MLLFITSSVTRLRYLVILLLHYRFVNNKMLSIINIIGLTRLYHVAKPALLKMLEFMLFIDLMRLHMNDKYIYLHFQYFFKLSLNIILTTTWILTSGSSTTRCCKSSRLSSSRYYISPSSTPCTRCWKSRRSKSPTKRWWTRCNYSLLVKY